MIHTGKGHVTHAYTLDSFYGCNTSEQLQNTLVIRRYTSDSVTEDIFGMKTDGTLSRIYICLHVPCNMLNGFEPELLHIRRTE
jgi:hypothetical protein